MKINRSQERKWPSAWRRCAGGGGKLTLLIGMVHNHQQILALALRGARYRQAYKHSSPAARSAK
jgi:hypothetical protein